MRFWLIVCLTLLQTLMSVGGSHALGIGPAREGDVAAVAEHCGGARRGDEAPARDGRAVHCCNFCVVGGCGVDLAITPAPTRLARFFVSTASPLRVALQRLPRRPLGWGCSWSSRAPPARS